MPSLRFVQLNPLVAVVCESGVVEGRERERERIFTVWSEIADSQLEKEATLICVVCVVEEEEEIIKINRKITIKKRQFENIGKSEL